MKWMYVVLPLATAGAAYIFWIQPAPENRQPQATPADFPSAANTAPGASASGAAATGIFASPFKRGAPVTVAPSQEQARQQHMEDAGYNTPGHYHHLPPTQLIAMAKQGDLFAMLQLGERYVYENQLAKSPGASAYQGNSADIGKRYFIDAVNAGHIPMAKALSRIYTEERNYIAAYAWELLHAKMSGKAPASPNSSLGAIELRQAERQADELWQAATLHYTPRG